MKNTSQTPVGVPRLLRRREVLARVGLSQTSMYEQIAAGQFPAPIPIGQKAVAWLESEISEWVELRIAMRDNGCKPVHIGYPKRARA